MATYLVGYDLKNPGQEYAELFTAIKNLSDGWWHHLDSTRIIGHPGPATTIRNSLVAYIDSGDKLLVVKLTGEGAWSGFNEEASKWLKSHL